MIDLHNHLLPGIDDGAKKVEETLEFLRIARRDGIHVVVATPHMKPGVYDNSREADPHAGVPPEPKLVLHVRHGEIIGPRDLSDTPEWAKAIVAAAIKA